MDMPYVGPYRILWGPDYRDRYALRDLHGRRFNEFHVSKLKYWPLEEDVLEDEYYIVEHILDWRRHGDDLEFLVKWRGYSKKHNTWEPLRSLNAGARATAMEMVDADEGEEASGEASGGNGVAGATTDDDDEARDNDDQAVGLVSTDGGEQQTTQEEQQRAERERRRLEREARRAAWLAARNKNA